MDPSWQAVAHAVSGAGTRLLLAAASSTSHGLNLGLQLFAAHVWEFSSARALKHCLDLRWPIDLTDLRGKHYVDGLPDFSETVVPEATASSFSALMAPSSR